MVLFAAALLAASVSAAPSASVSGPSFEAALGQFHAGLVAQRKAERRARAKDAASDLKTEDGNARILAKAAWQLRQNLLNLRQRARSRRARQPGQPDNDPFLSNDVQRFVYYLRSYALGCEQVERDMARIAGSIQRAPALSAAADALAQDAAEFRFQAAWLGAEARDGSFDLSGAGFGAEAGELLRLGPATAELARDIDSEAREIRSRVGS